MQIPIYIKTALEDLQICADDCPFLTTNDYDIAFCILFQTELNWSFETFLTERCDRCLNFTNA